MVTTTYGCYAAGLLIETCMWRKQLAAMLALKRLAGVAPEVNLKEHPSCMPLPSANIGCLSTLSLKPKGDTIKSPK